MTKRKKRVVVGMSGGVDSSVTAALLKKRGYDVVGMTMQLLPKEMEKTSACCNLGAVGDAKKVAAKIGIPHYTINSRSRFQEKVIDHFVNEYLSGQTPNPCVECNRHIKFDELWERAQDLGADYVATGHYCQRVYYPSRGVHHLKQAKDPSKDQSYFLYMVPSAQLKHILFPLGGYYKSEIRDMARELGLANADKPDSQEICFVSGKSYREFIGDYLKDKPLPGGDIVDMDGNKMGEHDGIHLFTIGQRRGLNLNSSEPYFVLQIRPADNTVVVGSRDSLKSHEIVLKNLVLANPEEQISGRKYGIKLRYQMALLSAKVVWQEADRCALKLSSQQSFVTPGQSCVLYDHNGRVVGGGIIEGGQ